jgi:phosphatidylserine/phosphatidylglycerophosphate/cardiolipin synthase-like enzyme
VVFHSNHQKSVIIDRKIAYIGGIDLTNLDGDRWDTNDHIPGEKSPRKYNKPERSWHDLAIVLEKTREDEASAVDYVFANFLARYDTATLYQFKNTAQTSTISVSDLDTVNVKRNDSQKKINTGNLTDLDLKTYVQAPKERNAYVYGSDRYRDLIVDSKSRKTEYPIVQIVRSMPRGGNYDPSSEDAKLSSNPDWFPAESPYALSNFYTYAENQLPVWNRSKNRIFECSAREAYLLGIKAAKKFIYLENQWVADELIWEALRQKAHEMAGDGYFKIIVVLPKKFLKAAGFGADQDIDLFPSVEKVAKEFKQFPDNFGMFSILQPSAVSDSTDRKHWEIPECTWDYVYIHSKLLIVDDILALIGSANAGGISLTGMLTEKQPDTELAALILDERGDESIVKKFRMELWAEHLQCDPIKLEHYKEGAKRFHDTACSHKYNTTNAKRVHYNMLYFPYSKNKSHLWKHLKWPILEKQIENRIKNPDKMHQTYYQLSAEMCMLYLLAKRDPPKYKDFAETIFNKGQFDFPFAGPDPESDVSIVLERNAELFNQFIDPALPILEIDWMLANTIQAGAFAVPQSLFERRGRAILGINTITCLRGNRTSYIEKALNHLRAGKTCIFELKMELFFNKNESRIAAEKINKKGEVNLSSAKNWISRISDNPFCRIQDEKSYPFYPGVLTPYDIKYQIGKNIFVCIEDPLQSNGNAYTMTFWTWGQKSTVPIEKSELINSLLSINLIGG